jgi:hypothetical protein
MQIHFALIEEGTGFLYIIILTLGCKALERNYNIINSRLDMIELTRDILCSTDIP